MPLLIQGIDLYMKPFVPERLSTIGNVVHFPLNGQNAVSFVRGFNSDVHGGGDDGDGGGDMERRLAVLETEVAHIKNDLSDLKKSVSAIENTANSIDKNMAVVLEKLGNISENLSKKPSSDAVDKKIAEAKIAQIIWTIGSVLTIVSIASGIIIKTLHV